MKQAPPDLPYSMQTRAVSVLAVLEPMWYHRCMINYELIRSGRRTVSLEVTKECTVRVRAPLHMPKKEIDAFVAAHQAWVERQLERQSRLLPPPEFDAEEIARRKEITRRRVEPLAEHYAARMGLRYAGIRVTVARKRYGSCSAADRLCFSCHLAELPQEAVELVVVHELCHIVHKNHGENFYALLESVFPDWRERKKKLTMG